jgi:hypothetical protein
MWQFIILFILLTPGILFTIPLYAKNGFGRVGIKILTAILHGLVFVTAANFFILEGMNGEGFQDTTRCGLFGTPSADGNIRIYTQYECEAYLGGIWNDNGECTKEGGGTYSYDCRFLNLCGTFGKPSADEKIRIYTQRECEEKLNGVWNDNGECTKKEGGTYSYDCRYLNTTTCEPGTGGDDIFSTSCKVCPPGKYSYEIASNKLDKISSNKAHYRVTHLCTPCPANTSSSIGGQTQCTQCGTGEKTNANKTRCFSCPSDKYFKTSGEGTCASCTGNTVMLSSRTGCAMCPVGKKPNSTRTACI